MRRPNSPPPRRSQDTGLRPVSPQPVPTLRRSSSDVSHPRKRLLAKLKNAGSASSGGAASLISNSGGSTAASRQFLPSHSRTGSNPALSPSAPSSTNAGSTVATSKANSSPSKSTRDMHRLAPIPPQMSLAPGMLPAASASTLSLASTATLAGNASNDPWNMLHVHVLPLFNGEALRMPIESLNELVKKHISTVVSRSPSRAISTLEQDVVAFLAAGMLTINAKLSERDDEKLLPRVVEIWEFFWHQVLPYVEGVFHPLQTDTVIRTLSRTPKTHRSSSPTTPDETSLTAPTQSIDVRTLALRSFRDSVILSIYSRLHMLLTAPRKDKEAKPQEKGYNHPRLQQMLLVLVSTAQHPNSLAEPLPPSQGEGAVAHLLRDIRSPQGATPARSFGDGRLSSFFSSSAPRDRRGRIARKSARYTMLNLKAVSAFTDGDEEWPDDETPRNAGFGYERDRERAILESLRSPDMDLDDSASVDAGAGGWGLGGGEEHRGEDEEEDEEPPDWDQAQNMMERMIGLRG